MQSDNHVIVLSRVDFIKNNYLQADFLIKTQNLELEANALEVISVIPVRANWYKVFVK